MEVAQLVKWNGRGESLDQPLPLCLQKVLLPLPFPPRGGARAAAAAEATACLRLTMNFPLHTKLDSWGIEDPGLTFHLKMTSSAASRAPAPFLLS